MQKPLIVDDEPNVLYSFCRRLEGVAPRCDRGDGAGAVEAVKAERPDAVVLDVRLPDMSGLDSFDRIRAIDHRVPVIIITAYSTTETAIDAMRRGAFDRLIKPVAVGQLRDVVAKAMELSRLRQVPAVLYDESSPENAERIVGRSEAMQRVYKDVGRVAPRDVPVLILGESGTGKELVARALYHYHYGRRSDRPFFALNCAALPEGLLESELFGHERRAFTGADRQQIGKFEQADGGTLFLDGVGDMTAATQAKLLRVLQEGRFERVGGRKTLRVGVRLIAATNRDLRAGIDGGMFRQDLFYRLNGYTIELPPLRERREDVPPLVDRFLREAGRDPSREDVSISEEALRLQE